MGPEHMFQGIFLSIAGFVGLWVDFSWIRTKPEYSFFIRFAMTFHSIMLFIGGMILGSIPSISQVFGKG